jgi:hypothetical protein
MSFGSMATELTGDIPRLPFDYAEKIVNRATLDAYRQNLWSFLAFEGNWTSPAWIQTGTVSVTQGQNTVQFDPLAATPALNAITLNQPSAVTQRQFRIGVGTIYNIWQYSAPSWTVNTSVSGSTYIVTWEAGSSDFTGGLAGAWSGLLIAINGVVYTILSVPDTTHMHLTATAGTQTGVAAQLGAIVTLDRNYQEPTAVASGYSIFQCYYVSPVPDFKSWASEQIRDMTNYNVLYTNKTRGWVNERDPQRTFYYIPTHVIPYQNDMNPVSATYGWPMFEIWGAPTYVLTWQLYGYRKGFVLVNGVPAPVSTTSLASGAPQALVNPSDDLPTALGEDCVMAKARTSAYSWAEANRRPEDGRRNFIQLKKDDDALYARLWKDYRRDDRERVDAWHTKFRRSQAWPNREPSYNAIAGVASPGA